MSRAEHVQEFLAAYALGALEQDELATVERHLAACPHCQQVLAEYKQVVDLLAYAPPVSAPPPDLRDRVLAQTSQQPVLSGRRPAIARPARASWWQRWWGPLAVVAASMLVLLLVVTFSMQQALHAERQQTRALVPRATEEAQLVALLISPQATKVVLEPSDQASAAAGRLVLDHARSRVLLVADRLPPLPEGMTYQVWLCTEAVKRSAGTFYPASDGHAQVELPLPVGGFAYEWVWVTVEPHGGSAEPQGETVLKATM